MCSAMLTKSLSLSHRWHPSVWPNPMNLQNAQTTTEERFGMWSRSVQLAALSLGNFFTIQRKPGHPSDNQMLDSIEKGAYMCLSNSSMCFCWTLNFSWSCLSLDRSGNIVSIGVIAVYQYHRDPRVTYFSISCCLIYMASAAASRLLKESLLESEPHALVILVSLRRLVASRFLTPTLPTIHGTLGHRYLLLPWRVMSLRMLWLGPVWQVGYAGEGEMRQSES